MRRLGEWITLVSILAVAPGFGQQSAAPASTAPAKGASRLVTAKLVAVTSMPEGLDQWLVEDLRAWGKYKVTSDPEGADLVIRGSKPDKEPQLTIPREGIPLPKHEKHEPPVLSVTVVDWVTSERLWQADILDKKSKGAAGEASAGSRTEINARGLKPDQLAQKLVAQLRDYVSQLEKSERTQQSERSKQ